MALASLTADYADALEAKGDRLKDQEEEGEEDSSRHVEEGESEKPAAAAASDDKDSSSPSEKEDDDEEEEEGPLLGPQPKAEPSWSYKGFRDFTKNPAASATAADTAEEKNANAAAAAAAAANADQSCYSYEGNVWIYTDPNTKARYMFDTTTNSWRSWDTTNYVFDGQTYWYTDGEGKKHRWNQHKSQWESVLSDCPIPSPAPTPSTSGGLVTATDKQEQMAVVYDYYQKKMSCNVAAFASSSGMLPELAKKNEAAAYWNLVVDSKPSIQSKVDGDRAARQLNHYFDHDAWLKKENEGKNEKPKFTKKQIQLLKKRRQEKKYKKSIEWLLDDGCGG